MDIKYVSLSTPLTVTSLTGPEMVRIMRELQKQIPAVQPLERGKTHTDIEPRTRFSLFTVTCNDDGTGLMACYPRPGSGAHLDIHNVVGSEIVADAAIGQLLMDRPKLIATTLDKTTLESGQIVFTIYGLIVSLL